MKQQSNFRFSVDSYYDYFFKLYDAQHTQTITRKTSFDSGHRVMNERMKCFNVHGHTYLCELTFEFATMRDIGYAIDFKEIKRVYVQWIDDLLDHGMILNPQDAALIEVTKQYGSKYWLMGLEGSVGYCNPTVENIAKEVFIAVDVLCYTGNKLTERGSAADTNPGGMDLGLRLSEVKLYETPNCFTTCNRTSVSGDELRNFCEIRYTSLVEYALSKGVVEYDDRRV